MRKKNVCHIEILCTQSLSFLAIGTNATSRSRRASGRVDRGEPVSRDRPAPVHSLSTGSRTQSVHRRRATAAGESCASRLPVAVGKCVRISASSRLLLRTLRCSLQVPSESAGSRKERRGKQPKREETRGEESSTARPSELHQSGH